MSKYFIAHKVSGENKETLEVEMKAICKKLEEKELEYYCSFLDENMRKEQSKKVLIENAFEKIDESEKMIAIMKTEEESQGMLLEIGYAKAKAKTIILLAKKGINTKYIGQVANETIEFENSEDLENKIGELHE